jgi:hypothetical protein
MTLIEIINSFVAEKLDGDIQRLADFPLGYLLARWIYESRTFHHRMPPLYRFQHKDY